MTVNCELALIRNILKAVRLKGKVIQKLCRGLIEGVHAMLFSEYGLGEILLFDICLHGKSHMKNMKKIV